MNEERLTELIDIYLGLLAERQLQRQIASFVRPQQQSGDGAVDAEYHEHTPDRRAIAPSQQPQQSAQQPEKQIGKTPRYKSGTKAIGSGNEPHPQHPSQQQPGSGPYQAGPYGGPQS